MLKNTGLHTRNATDRPNALQELEQAIETGRVPELILLDSDLPETDSLDLAARFRDIPELRDTLLIMMTSGAKTDDANRYRRIGIDGCLSKPVRQSDLIGLIKQILVCAPNSYLACDSYVDAPRPAASEFGLKILVAEDNLVNQKLAESLLIKAGHRVALASNGVEAVDAVEKEPFDLVFLDIQMPEMDGLAAAERIREIDRTTGRHTPLVAMTAHALKGDRERFLNNGFDGYLAKPVSYDAVLDVLKMVRSDDPETQSAAPHLEISRSRPEPDLAVLLTKAGGDYELVREMISIFLEELPNRMKSIESALLNNQPREVELAAHSLKGSLGYFSTSGAFESTGMLVKMARRKNLEGAQAVFDRLKEQTRRLELSLADWLNGLGAA
jgi:CheY-like chemotaxis protein